MRAALELLWLLVALAVGADEPIHVYPSKVLSLLLVDRETRGR